MSFRLTHKNRLLTELALLEKRLERANHASVELRKGGCIRDQEFVEQQIQQNNDVIESTTEEIVVLRETLRKLERGDLDEDIQAEMNENMKQVEQKRLIQDKKDRLAAERDAINRKIASTYQQKQRNVDYLNRSSLYQMQKEYERLCDMDIPSYISDNLRTMPNNKGYVWRGVWLFGEKPAEKGPCVMFEKQRETMFIHEIFEKEHHVYKKQGQKPKEFVKTIMRRPMKLAR